MKYDLLHIQGKPYVLVPLHEFRTMTSAGNDNTLPPDILDKLAARQQHPLRILRDHRGLTQSQLAEKAGISRPYLTEIETGRKEGSIRAMKALAQVLETDISYLT
jgi:DNA-binding XRE family transcriptional regulator